MLRLLITQRLTAAAEEIFGVFGRTIAEYEEEISRSKLEIERQRRLLELSLQPEVSVQLRSAGEEPHGRYQALSAGHCSLSSRCMKLLFTNAKYTNIIC